MYFSLIMRTLILYLFIVICYRIMGKKEVGQLGVIDLIVSFLIAELAAICIEDETKSIFTSIVPISILVIIQILLSYVTLKNIKTRKIVDGKPSVLINKGKINFSIMSKLRYSLDDLLTQLREKDIKNIEDVNYAILENNGELSVFKDNEYPLPLIIEGKIEVETLKNIGRSYVWLNKILENRKVSLKDVFYAFYTKEQVYIITKKELL